MKIAIDRHIPFIEGVFEPFGIEVSYEEEVNFRGADAVIIRTRTLCNRSTLEGYAPKIIATATIGFDHIDIEYCRERGIEVATAAGCNARGVAQWVFAALIALGVEKPCDYTLGIVGVGNVGSIVDQVAKSVGFRTLLCDPPRAAAGEKSFVGLGELLRDSDIVTLHVPLNVQTRGMVSFEFLDRMKNNAIFLNSSRGEIVDEKALMESQLEKIGLDVWCNEPLINNDLLVRAMIATPHIAGYSMQGKAMGTAMSVRSVAKTLGIKELENWYPPQVTPTIPKFDISWEELCAQMPRYYDISEDDKRLKSAPELFENQRSNYKYREEFF